MTTKKPALTEDKIVHYEQALQKINTYLVNAYQGVSPEKAEQQELEALQALLQEATQRLNTARSKLASPSPKKGDDPIKKRVMNKIDLWLETHAYIRVWKKGATALHLEQRIELESEQQPAYIELPTHCRVEINTWSRSTLTYDRYPFAPHKELTEKNFTVVLEVDRGGRFTLKDQQEKVEQHTNHPDMLALDLTLQIVYPENGQTLRVQTEAYLPPYILVKKGKNLDTTETIKETSMPKHVMKTISPMLRFGLPKVDFGGASLELVFEEENQVELSEDQLNILYKWWKNLKSEYKDVIRNRQAKIIVRGYTSSTGDERYNMTLGTKRAKYVYDYLNDIIGSSDGKNIAKIYIESAGEHEEDRKHVKITVISN